MDDMTWMSSFYELPLQPEKRRPPGFWTAALLAVVGCGGLALAVWSRAPAPAGPVGANAGPAR